MAAAGKPSKKKLKKQFQTKTSFTSPFSAEWSPLPQTDMHFILETLKEKLVFIGLEKKEVKASRQWRKKKPASTSETAPKVSQEGQVSEPKTNGWTDVAARQQLAIGINEVTKALERNELQLLLVCKSAQPPHMTNHLIALSATRGVPACRVPRLSESVSEPLGLKSVLALGFRQSASDSGGIFQDTVDVIKQRVPSLEVAWLQTAVTTEVAAEHLAGREQREQQEKATHEGDEVAGKMQGQKRKLESDSDKITESPTICTLQPLKVKRIVANPAKKKKKKKASQNKHC